MGSRKEIDVSDKRLWKNFEIWEESIKQVYTILKIEKEKPASYDILNYKIYNLKFEVEWIWCYLNQLHRAWEEGKLQDTVVLHNLNRLGIIIITKLGKLTKYKGKHIPFNTLQIYRRFRVAVQTFGSKKFISPNKELVRFLKEVLQYYWMKYYDLKKMLNSIRISLFYLIYQYNERQESKQIVTTSEQYIMFGERIGIMDQTYIALNNLFTDYCGTCRDEKNKHIKWNGLILPHSDKDFSIFSHIQILFLPFGFKFNTHDRFLLLAHEAAHFIFDNILPQSETFKTLQRDVWEPLYRSAIQVVDELIQISEEDGQLESLRKIKDILEDDIGYPAKEKSFTKSELLVDLLAGLIAGPGYYKNLAIEQYFPPDLKKKYAQRTTIENYPKAWLRIMYGFTCNAKFVDGYDKWKLQEAWDYTLKYHANIDEDIEYIMEDITHEERKGTFLDNVVDTTHLFSDPMFYLIKVLLTDGRHFKALWKWAATHFNEGFLFFPYGGNNKETTREKYNKCKKIAQRLLHNDELVMDESPKDIAAASIILPIKRPLYPQGQIIHSLIYSSSRNPQGEADDA